MRRAMTIAGFVLTFVLAVAVSLGGARYLLPVPGAPAPLMIPHLERWPSAVIVPIAGGLTALTLGLFQLVMRKGPRRAWHSHAGRIYVLACPSSAVACAWFAATARVCRKAVEGEFDEQRRWMVRSLALTFSAVTLRILLPLSSLSGVKFDDAYRAVSFLCWVPNMFLAELWLRVWGWGRPADRHLISQKQAG